MKNLLIVGASSGVGLALAQRVKGDYQLWTAGRRHPHVDGVNHIDWDATKGALQASYLPVKLDGLVYCPGTIRLQTFTKLKDSDFEQDLEINVMGAIRAIRCALPALKEAGNASVVLFSTVAVATGMSMHASVAAAKGAIEGLTRSLAAEYAPDIRFNAIAPSLTDTPLATPLLRSDRQREAAANRHPLKRIGSVDDMAAAAEFLLSDRSSWMTGQILKVDGGLGDLRMLT